MPRPTGLPPAVGVRGGQRTVGGVHGGLGDAVEVDHLRPAVAVAVEPGTEDPRVQRLTAEEHPAERVQAPLSIRRLQELVEGRGRLVEHGHALARQQLVEPFRRAGHVLRHDDEPAAVGERPPDLPDREVEGEGVEHRPDVLGAEAEPGLGLAHEPRRAGVGHADAFRAAGGAGGVDDVGEVAGGGAPAQGSRPGLRAQRPYGRFLDLLHAPKGHRIRSPGRKPWAGVPSRGTGNRPAPSSPPARPAWSAERAHRCPPESIRGDRTDGSDRAASRRLQPGARRGSQRSARASAPGRCATGISGPTPSATRPCAKPFARSASSP